MPHQHPQIPVTPGPRDRISDHSRRQLGLVLGAAGDGCTACAESLLGGLTEPAAVGLLAAMARRTAAVLHDGALPDDLTDGTDGPGRDFRSLVRAITETADPAAVAGQMTVAQRREASRTAAHVIAAYTGDAYQSARDRASASTQTLPEACLAQAGLMHAWWQAHNPRQAADVRDGWHQACGHTGIRADALEGRSAAVYVLGAVLHSLAREAGIRAEMIHTLPYTRALPLIRDREAVVRIVTDFVSPPALEGAGFYVKRLAIYAPDAPMFAVLRLWADLICAAHAADCTDQGPGHECTLEDRAAVLTPRANAA